MRVEMMLTFISPSSTSQRRSETFRHYLPMSSYRRRSFIYEGFILISHGLTELRACDMAANGEIRFFSKLLMA